ncbi:MAG TPA: DUF3592 domain-containing protein [Verrucomicrobiae bacterium]|nr:DUF3592 domain-containing protein [Verrucomicrobiae bacterium]
MKQTASARKNCSVTRSLLNCGVARRLCDSIDRRLRPVAMFFQRQSRKYIGGLLIIAGSICLFIAFVSFLYSLHFVHTAAHANGKILRMLEQKDKDERTIYYPVFTFSDAQGAEHTIHSSSGSFPPAYEVGDTVPVLYSSTSPTHAKIDAYFSVWGISTITGIIGGIDLPAGLIVWFWPALVGFFRRKPPVYVV